MTTLNAQATQVRLREVSQNPVSSYLLLAPVQPTLADSRALTEKMKAVGFDDFFILWRGPNKGRVSLGVYKNETYAEERQARLRKLGFESELLPRIEKRSRFWLDVELLPQITSLDLAAAGQLPGEAEIGVSQCEILANSEPPGPTLAEASVLF